MATLRADDQATLFTLDHCASPGVKRLAYVSSAERRDVELSVDALELTSKS
jgi:hypothetical protein